MSRGVRHCHIDSGSDFQAYAQELTEEVGAINHELHTGSAAGSFAVDFDS